MKYQMVIPPELDRRIKRIMRFSMHSAISEFCRDALRYYVEKLEDNYKLEIQEQKQSSQ
jgi:hypothetical protein